MLLMSADSFLVVQRDQIVALAARHAVPALYPRREFTAVSGLMSYGPSLPEAYYHVGSYTGRILKGEKPVGAPAGFLRADAAAVRAGRGGCELPCRAEVDSVDVDRIAFALFRAFANAPLAALALLSQCTRASLYAMRRVLRSMVTT